MFEASSEPVTAADVRGLAAALRRLTDTGGVGAAGPGETADAAAEGAVLVEQLRALEELKSAAAAAQARITARFAAGQRAAQRARGVAASECGRGVAAQVALARRDSPARGSRHLGLAEALVHEMPHTLAALEAGQISEWRATLVVRETACLSAEHRSRVDAELAARPGGLGAMGDRTIADEARRIGYRLDPHAVTDRAARAAGDRRVGLRPAPDTMCVLSGLLPAPQGVAAYAALSKHADACRARGDQRTRGQIMADTLVERVTGQARADAVPVEVSVVMTERSLLGDSHEPAELAGHGPLPAPFTRRWLRGEPGSAGDEPGRRPDRRDRGGGRAARGGSGVAAPALYHSGDRRAGGDGVHPPLLRRRAAPAGHPARPALPHPMV